MGGHMLISNGLSELVNKVLHNCLSYYTVHITQHLRYIMFPFPYAYAYATCIVLHNPDSTTTVDGFEIKMSLNTNLFRGEDVINKGKTYKIVRLYAAKKGKTKLSYSKS